MNDIVNPFLNEDGQLQIGECVEHLLRYGFYWNDSKSGTYYSFNGKCWHDVPRVMFEKRLLAILGEEISSRTRNEILSTFTARISTISFDSEDAPRGLINLANGVLDIERNQLILHSKEYFFFHVIPTHYDPIATCPRWETFLLEVMLQDLELVQLIQEMFGYCLVSGNWFQMAFILYGEGENGKSVVLEVLRNMLGVPNTSALSLSDISERFRRIELMGKLANVCEETPTGKAIESDIFKNLVSGGLVSAEQKHKPCFKFQNHAKLVFACNSVPVTKDHTHSFYRRLSVIPFKFTVPDGKRDHALATKLLNELPGILNWAIVGYKRLTANHRFSTATSAQLAKNQFAREGDSVRMFIDELCDVGADYQVSCELLYNFYKSFSISNGYHPCAQNEFGKRLRTHSQAERDRDSTGDRRHFYRGIQYSACA